MIDFFIGEVLRLVGEKEDHVIEAKVDGIIDCVKAFPVSSELDEPKEGDKVILHRLDNIFNSYFTYQKLKENNIIGIRASGKMIDITPEAIVIGVFDKDCKYKDNQVPECHTRVIIDHEGNITLDISEGKTLKTNTGDTTPGTMTKEQVGTIPGDGPFNCIQVCPYMTVPHCGNIFTSKYKFVETTVGAGEAVKSTTEDSNNTTTQSEETNTTTTQVEETTTTDENSSSESMTD